MLPFRPSLGPILAPLVRRGCRCRSMSATVGPSTVSDGDRTGSRVGTFQGDVRPRGRGSNVVAAPSKLRGVVGVEELHTAWLTREAYDRLRQELQRLLAHRPVIAAEINERRQDGDLRENDAYRAVREEQGKEEARIRQLQQLLREAKIEEQPTARGLVEPGMVLTVAYEDGEMERFLLATRAAGAQGNLEVYSPESPLGHSLLGAREGETREYALPNGQTMRATLVKVEPYRG